MRERSQKKIRIILRDGLNSIPINCSIFVWLNGGMVYTEDLKSFASNGLRVRIPLQLLTKLVIMSQEEKSKRQLILLNLIPLATSETLLYPRWKVLWNMRTNFGVDTKLTSDDLEELVKDGLLQEISLFGVRYYRHC